MAARKEAAAANAGKDMARRYRPIAPRPAQPPPAPLMPAMGDAAGGGSMLWQPRKRGRQEHLLLPPVPKRERDVASSHYPPAPAWAAAGGSGGGASSSSSSHARRAPIPVERHLISRLQVPRVIKPRAARPRRTTICIDSSNIAAAAAVSKKTAREVEAELELPGALPAVVSGQHNRVHLANEGYKAMVGQPVCPWLDSVPGAGASRRINGIVVLHVRKFGPPAASSRLPPPDTACGAGAFPCAARISWECEGAIASLTVPCAVERLTGDSSGDYLFIWRFDSSRASIIYCIA
ncbi:hypothetical protein BS78_01G313300 [Paspalum vaginatum]|nr:hypothetical protein BS78_01G313300 [Paspalum vaginatum]